MYWGPDEAHVSNFTERKSVALGKTILVKKVIPVFPFSPMLAQTMPEAGQVHSYIL